MKFRIGNVAYDKRRRGGMLLRYLVHRHKHGGTTSTRNQPRKLILLSIGQRQRNQHAFPARST